MTRKLVNLVKKLFKSGILVSIKSTIALYNELKDEGIKYFLSCRLNQDALENLFSQVRQMGGQHSHPSAGEVASRLRKICLCKNVSNIVTNCPVEYVEDEDYVSSILLNQVVVVSEDTNFIDDVSDVSEVEIDDFLKESNEPRDYVAGYISKKLHLHHSTDIDKDSWIFVKGEGRLIQPTKDLCDIVEQCDIIFDEFHGKGIKCCSDPLSKLNALISSKHPSFPSPIVSLFCRVKFHSRIKQMNTKLKLKKLNKSVRSYKQTAQFMN